MIKNVIFDLGGVVLDWNPGKIKAHFKGNMDLPTFLFEKGFFQRYWTEFDRGMVTEEEIIGQMSAFSGCSLSDCRELVEFIKHSLTDIPETQELIRQLSAEGYKLFCLSNMAVEFYDYLKGREVFKYFDGQIISGLEHEIKPEEAIYCLLPERFGIKPEESLFIDDLEANIETAARLGFHTVHFSERTKGYREIREKLGK